MKLTHLPLITLCLSWLSVVGQTPRISWTEVHNGTYKFSAHNLPSPIPSPGARGTASWGYFWEFGDGQYSTSKHPHHAFPEAKGYTVSLYLTPKYSASPPVVLSSKGFRAAKSKNKAIGKASRSGRLVSIKANQELVPEQDMQVVIRYQAPDHAIGHGYLAFFYNKKREGGLSYKPFKVEKSKIRRYFGEAPQGSFPPELAENSQVQQLKQNHDYVLFKVPAMKAHEERQLFLSVHAYEDLLQLDGTATFLSYTAMWLPEGMAPGMGMAKYSMKVQGAHDPNNIRLDEGFITYREGVPAKITYTINFYNKGDGDALKIKIRVPMAKGLDYRSLKVVSSQIGEDACHICAADIGQFGCLSAEIMPNHLSIKPGDSMIVFTFHGVTLLGKTNRKRRSDGKGNIVYSIKTKGHRIDHANAQAFIIFNHEKAIKTNKVTTAFVRHGLGLSLGVTAPSILAREAMTGNLRPFTEVSYSINPINTGFSPTISMAYAPFRFRQEWGEVLPDDPALPAGSRAAYTTDLSVRYLDLNLQLQYRMIRFLSIGVGGGIGFPVSVAASDEVGLLDGTGNLLASNVIDQHFGPVHDLSKNASAVHFQNPDYTLPLREMAAARSINGFVSANILGVNNGLSFGLRLNLKRYPHLYTLRNTTLFSTVLTLDYKL